MILADKIMCLRKQKGWSQEELANRVGVSRQSVSKWESETSVPEMDKIVLLSSIFNVSTDYLLRDDMVDDSNIYDSEKISIKKKTVWKQNEVDSYIENLDSYSKFTGLGVFLCMLGVINLLQFGGKSEYGVFGLTESTSLVIGLAGMFILIAIAVAIFIVASNNHDQYNPVLRNEVYIEERLKEQVREIKDLYRSKYNLGITVGVILCILAVLPLIIGGIVGLEDVDLISLVILLIGVVAIAVYMFIRVSIKFDGYTQLLNQKESSVEAQEVNEISEKVTTIYWSLVVGIYLGWSFYTNDWGLSWIVFPVAGVLQSIIPNIISLKMRKK